MSTVEKSELNQLEVSFIDTVVSENLIENLGSISEALLDSELADGIIQNIPFFDVLYKTGKITLAIRDKLFEKKVLKFLLEIKDISQSDRLDFIKELEEKSGQNAGEVLLMLIERLDNMEKPKMIANLLKAKVNKNISIEKFLRLSSIIDRGFLLDLKKLHLFEFSSGNYEEDITESLFSLGLLYIEPITGIRQTFDANLIIDDNSGNKYKITNIGRDLLHYGLKTMS